MPVGESCEHVFLGPPPGRGSRAAISEAAREQEFVIRTGASLGGERIGPLSPLPGDG